jgi:hypothetical protein
LGQIYCKQRLVSAQGAVLDLWEASLYGATQQLVWVLRTGLNQAILLLASPGSKVKNWKSPYMKKN